MSWIRIPYVMDSNPYSRMSSECLKEDQIRIPVFWIRIPIPKSFFRSKKMKFGLWIQIPMGWIQIAMRWIWILSVKILNRSFNLHYDKKGHFSLCFEYFLTWSISDKSENKVQNLTYLLVPDRFKLIYHLNIGSIEASRIMVKLNLK